MTETMTETMWRVHEQEIRNNRKAPTARQWLEAKADAPEYSRDCPDCGGSARDISDWSLPCRACKPSRFEARDRDCPWCGGRDSCACKSFDKPLNGYDARAVAVLRVLLETDVRIVRPHKTGQVDSLSCENGGENWMLHHDALWVISFASDIKTRRLQIIVTSWGNRHHPRPGQHYRRSPVVVLTRLSVTDWLDEFTY